MWVIDQSYNPPVPWLLQLPLVNPPFKQLPKGGRRGGSGGHSLHDAAATKTCGTIKVSITLFLLCPNSVRVDIQKSAICRHCTQCCLPWCLLSIINIFWIFWWKRRRRNKQFKPLTFKSWKLQPRVRLYALF